MDEDALVLDSRDHGESDLIITFFGKNIGRITAIAKGARKSRKRFVNKLEIFSFLEISLSQKANASLAFLQEAELYTGFTRLRQDIPCYYAASAIREYLLAGIKELEPNGSLFALSLWALHNLDRGSPVKATFTLFLLRYFSCLGYRPDLSGCNDCGKPLNPRARYAFHLAGGILSCSFCGAPRGESVQLSHGTIRALATAQELPLEKLHRVKLTGPILDEAKMTLTSYGTQILQRDMISLKYLNG